MPDRSRFKLVLFKPSLDMVTRTEEPFVLPTSLNDVGVLANVIVFVNEQLAADTINTQSHCTLNR